MVHVIEELSTSMFVVVFSAWSVARINNVPMPMMRVSAKILTKIAQLFFGIAYVHRSTEFNFDGFGLCLTSQLLLFYHEKATMPKQSWQKNSQHTPEVSWDVGSAWRFARWIAWCSWPVCLTLVKVPLLKNFVGAISNCCGISILSLS